MSGPIIGLDVLQPADGAVVSPGQQVSAAGRATGKAGLEPVEIDRVTLSVDGGPAAEGSLRQIPHQPAPTYSWTASIQAPAEPGPHQIVVRAVASGGVATVTRPVGINVQAQPPPAAFTPRQSLELSVVNPGPPSTGDWAAAIVKANRSDLDLTVLDAAVLFDRGDRYPVCRREWNQVTAPAEDYDRDTAGFSGWLFGPELSGADVPFTHPFGNDWECQVVLDPEFAGLLAPGNVVPDEDGGVEAVEAAESLGLPGPGMTIQDLGGLLGVETDSRCVPHALQPPFGDVIRPGDRIAILGRWIVDAGHSVAVPPGHTPQLPAGGTSYRSEVHPPLLMAIGGTRVLAPTDIRTRIVLTSRPYLVTQVYTTDTGTIYDDAGSTDGTLLDHLSQEIDKLDHDWTRLGLPDSTRIEVHPKIAAKPFNGVHIARFTIRPPDPAGLAGPTFGEAQVSFQFTCRSGVGVQVIGFDDIVGKKRQARVELLVVLNSAGYQPPRLPPRQEYVPTDKQLEDASTLVGVELIADLFGPNDPLTKANIAQALLRGILTDAYDVPGVNLLDKTHAVPFVEVINIPGAAGIVVDDDQPYPVFGFLDIRWHRPDIIRGGGP